jgi:DNA primase large subunit
MTAQPPCIIHILDSLRNGEEISNAAKVLLLTYELANGKTVSDIAKIVGGGDLRVNAYQIEHLGLMGRSIVYQLVTKPYARIFVMQLTNVLE